MLNDAPLLYRWRTDEESRRNSITKHIFTGQTHIGWLCEQLAKQCPMYIGQVGPAAVGAVYLTKHATAINDDKANMEDDYIVSIMVAPEHRRQGHGKDLLRQALKTADRPCYAEILNHNVASQRIFESCGFVVQCVNSDSKRYKWAPNER